MSSEQGEGGSGKGVPCDSSSFLSGLGKELAVARRQREEMFQVSGEGPQSVTASPPKHTLTHAYGLGYPQPLTKKVFEASGRSLEKTR